MNTKDYYQANKSKWATYYKVRRQRFPLYATWRSILCRTGHVGTPKDHEIKDYINRGIDICDEWKDYETFQKWCFENGWQRGLLIDRIDNDKGYSPENCRFVTPLRNQLNRRCTHFIFVDGEKTTLYDYWEKYHIDEISYKCAENRYRRGWDFKRAVTVKKCKR